MYWIIEPRRTQLYFDFLLEIDTTGESNLLKHYSDRPTDFTIGVRTYVRTYVKRISMKKF